jgi:phosphohistidine phosphatase
MVNMNRQLFVVRHAIAEEREDFRKTGKSDDLRPITERGAKKMKSISKWLETQAPLVDVLLYSPLARSEQTASLLLEQLNCRKSLKSIALRPTEHPKKLAKQLDSLNWKTAMVVGHEPHLSHLMCYLLGVSMKHSEQFVLKKGGVASLLFDSSVQSQKAKNQWLLTPRVILSSLV